LDYNYSLVVKSSYSSSLHKSNKISVSKSLISMPSNEKSLYSSLKASQAASSAKYKAVSLVLQIFNS